MDYSGNNAKLLHRQIHYNTRTYIIPQLVLYFKYRSVLQSESNLLSYVPTVCTQHILFVPSQWISETGTDNRSLIKTGINKTTIFSVLFTFSHLADALIQSDLQ